MTDKRLTDAGIPVVTSLADGDLIYAVDISDTTDHSTGTSVKIARSNLLPTSIANVVEDTTPQLGGTLDANGNTIDMGVNLVTDTKVGQWDTAFGWGDHASGGYLTDVVSDTTPQLGGDLDPNGNDIDGTGSLNIAAKARSVSASGNTATTDYGIVIRMTGGSAQTFTLDADPPTNGWVLLDNSSGNTWTIAASSSLIWAEDSTTGNRTLADDGMAVALHRGAGVWIINGGGLT